MIRDVLAEGGMVFADLDGIAYTAGPGLVGALMVGGSLANRVGDGPRETRHPGAPHGGAPAGGHARGRPPVFPPSSRCWCPEDTPCLVEARGLGDYAILGETLDDAAGEAFDKVARLLSLPYPGGPPLAALAEDGDPEASQFPRPRLPQGPGLQFQRSQNGRAAGAGAFPRPTVARCQRSCAPTWRHRFQAAAVETLVEKCLRACDETGLMQLVIAGGVGANTRLRRQLKTRGGDRGITVHYPRQSLCTDNGAMIALTGWHRRREAAQSSAIVARPRWPLDELRPPPSPAAGSN